MRWTFLLPVAAAVSLVAGKTSTNARCGNAYNALPGGMTCKGSQWGDCCSQYGYCGKTKDYCGTGCQSPFGTCNSVATPARISTSSSTSTRTASSAAASSTGIKGKVTTNARCGNLYGASPAGMTCLGGKYGDCCSQYSYCGSSSAYCGTGCQPGFGRCDADSSSSTASSSSFSSSSSSSSFVSSSASSSSSTSFSISSTSEMITSTTLSSSLSSESPTPSSISTSSTESSEAAITSATSTLTTSSSTAAPSPTGDKFCGVEGYDTVDLQIWSSAPFTTTDACSASCRANSVCGSFIIYSGNCYLARLPITSTNVVAYPGTGITYSNPDCGSSASTTTAPATTLATSTTPTSTVCVAPAPTVSCEAYPECPQFTTPLSDACPANGAQCKDNYFVRCENVPASGSQEIISTAFPTVDMCRQACDGLNQCFAFTYSGTYCTLYSSLNGFVYNTSKTTFIRICSDPCASQQPVRRDEGRAGVGSGDEKSVSIKGWNNRVEAI